MNDEQQDAWGAGEGRQKRGRQKASGSDARGWAEVERRRTKATRKGAQEESASREQEKLMAQKQRDSPVGTGSSVPPLEVERRKLGKSVREQRVDGGWWWSSLEDGEEALDPD